MCFHYYQEVFFAKNSFAQTSYVHVTVIFIQRKVASMALVLE